jgi:hypothetical protein
VEQGFRNQIVAYSYFGFKNRWYANGVSYYMKAEKISFMVKMELYKEI